MRSFRPARSHAAAVASQAYNATAVYNLGLALVRAGQAEEGQKTMERFRALKEGGYATLLGSCCGHLDGSDELGELNSAAADPVIRGKDAHDEACKSEAHNRER